MFIIWSVVRTSGLSVSDSCMFIGKVFDIDLANFKHGSVYFIHLRLTDLIILIGLSSF